MDPMTEGSWSLVARAGELATAGDHRAMNLGSESIVLIRGDDGELRAFYNVCRHRGHEVVPPDGGGNARALKCPYHGWVYGLDGECRATPRFGDVSLEKASFPLIPVSSRTVDGDLYVDPTAPA
jgi:phenylpropionate dioxygenase-like ring-hydroxylating dioxygenase large terminal subunit